MGCTSSAPNMADAENQTGYSIKKTEYEVVENKKETDQMENDNASKEVKLVLPKCDNLENLQLASENVPSANGICTAERDRANEIDKKTRTQETSDIKENVKYSSDEKLSSMKEVVDKVILDNLIERVENQSTPNDAEEEILIKNEDLPVIEAPTQEKEDKEDKKNQDPVVENLEDRSQEQDVEINVVGETPSPTQSECSKATRWEALADIAAELPPSLAVDPVTGQIYSLAK